MGRATAGEVGKGWKSVQALNTDSVLIIKVIDVAAGKRESFSWRCFDPADGRSVRLSTSAALPIGVQAPFYWSERGLLLYESVEGITAFGLPIQMEKVVVPIDGERYRIKSIFASPESRGQVAYILAEFADDRKTVRAKLSATGGPIRLGIKEHALHLWDSRSNVSRKIATFATPPVSADVDWSREALWALTGEGKLRDLVRLELGSGQAEIVTKTDSLSSLTIAPSGAILAWNQHNSPRIMQVNSATSQVPLTDFGWFPAYSPMRNQFAFTVSDHEVWVGGEAAPERVMAFPSEVTQRSSDQIVWDASGNSFSVFLAQGAVGGGRNRPLVIADCLRKEVMLTAEFISVASTGERAWVPRDAVKGLI